MIAPSMHVYFLISGYIEMLLRFISLLVVGLTGVSIDTRQIIVYTLLHVLCMAL